MTTTVEAYIRTHEIPTRPVPEELHNLTTRIHTLDGAIRLAEELLPEGWVIQLQIAPNQKWLQLITPDDRELFIEPTDHSLMARCLYAIKLADRCQAHFEEIDNG